MFCNLFSTKVYEHTLLWIKHMVEMFCALFWTKIRFYESNVRFEIFCSQFCTRLDEDTLLWWNICSKMFFALFCTKLDEDAFLWIKCVVQSASNLFWEKIEEETFLWIKYLVQTNLYYVLYKARLTYVSLNQIGSKCFVLCFAQSSMKIHYSNVWFKNVYALFFSLWILMPQNALYSVLHKARWIYFIWIDC